jgi:hypothetical protein
MESPTLYPGCVVRTPGLEGGSTQARVGAVHAAAAATINTAARPSPPLCITLTANVH